MITPGMKNGETRFGPRSSMTLWVRSINGKPPIPEPATFCLLGLGGLCLIRKRRSKSKGFFWNVDSRSVLLLQNGVPSKDVR